jgi:hypothetical protein
MAIDVTSTPGIDESSVQVAAFEPTLVGPVVRRADEGSRGGDHWVLAGHRWSISRRRGVTEATAGNRPR